MSMEIVRVPDIGSEDPVDVIEVSVRAGDELAEEATIVVLESDKATVEVPLPMAGTVKKVLVKTGDRVKQGDPLLELDVADSGTEPEIASAPQASAEESEKVPEKASSADQVAEKQLSATALDTARFPENEQQEKPAAQVEPDVPSNVAADLSIEMAANSVHAGPAVRKLARELGVNIAAVTGTGPRQRILQEDVHAWVKQQLNQSASSGPSSGVGLPVLTEVDFSRFGPVERIELNKLRKVAASNLHRSWLTIPHVTQHDEADITELEAFRQSENVRLAKDGHKLTMLAFLVRACAIALEKFPRFNSSLSVNGETLIEKRYIHIGVAVETENGLMVPVLRDANKKGIIEIGAEVAELAAKARNRKLTPADMQGGTFSISSLGGIGGTAFTPIVNWPEVAILGVSKSAMKPHWNGQKFEPRLMLPLSLSYDHRVIDGADAARFITYLNQLLTDLRRALL